MAILQTISGIGSAQAVNDSADVSGLPLVEVQSKAAGRLMALFISGDGGWVGIDKHIARVLADSGIAVVGLNAKSYLSNRRSPDSVAADVARVLRHYLVAWGRDRVMIVGYSRGAVIAPFIVNRLPQDLKLRVDLVAMVGLGRRAGFHVGFFSFLGSNSSPLDPLVRPEIDSLRVAGVAMMCIYGADESESLCRDAEEGLMVKVARSGGHHFDRDYSGVAEDILRYLPRSPVTSPKPSQREP